MPDTITTNSRGGKQSHLDGRCDLLPALGVLDVAKVVALGAERYAPFNWHDISVAEHLNHALTHLMHHVAGDEGEDHLAHAGCRLLFALEIRQLAADGKWTEADGCRCGHCVERKGLEPSVGQQIIDSLREYRDRLADPLDDLPSLEPDEHYVDTFRGAMGDKIFAWRSDCNCEPCCRNRREYEKATNGAA